ncbi:hypothetical protein L7F22_017328 [Adiantum nelumboides]|nr:hypothetical protein [Adiantum nelumboides]
MFEAVAAHGILPWRLATSLNALKPPDRGGFVKLGVHGFLSARGGIHCTRAGINGEKGSLERQSDTEAEVSRSIECSDVAEKETMAEKETTKKETTRKQLRLPEEGYIGLFVRMLGMDNPVEDREEAVRALWRHSMGGLDCTNEIVDFPGILTLVVTLLPSARTASSEAAAGLLRNVSSFDIHRTFVAESGAVEELVGILTRRTVVQEVRIILFLQRIF